MVTTAAVFEALGPLFDARPQAVLAASTYDGTILYANEAAGRAAEVLANHVPHLPIELVGRPITEVAELFRIDLAATAVGRALKDGQLHTRFAGDRWRCSSTIPLSEGTTVLATGHEADSEEQAVHEHLALRVRAAMAIEFCEAERLAHVGMEALHRSRQRIQRCRELLADETLLLREPEAG